MQGIWRGIVRAFFVLAALGVSLLGYALFIEPERLLVRELALGEGERSLRVVLVADLHFGGRVVDAGKGRQVVALINEQAPDLVLIPGDFVNGHEPKSGHIAAEIAVIENGVGTLAGLNAPTYASLGNHDTWYGKDEVARLLREAGVTVLNNDGMSADGVCIAGMADHDTDVPTPEGYAACEAGDVVLVMMHSPDSRGLLRSDTTLAVAGHTHGGQVNLPLLGRAVTSTSCGKPCAYGLIQTTPPLVVTAGIGTSILPIRFRSPPEIVVITLRY